MHRFFHMQSYWWVWFLGIEMRILEQKFMLRALEPNSEHLHPRKLSAIR